MADCALQCYYFNSVTRCRIIIVRAVEDSAAVYSCAMQTQTTYSAI